MKGIINIIIFLLITNYLFSASAKTIYGDCNSSDKKKRYKSKTYIDLDGDNKYDVVKIFWCNGATTTAPYKEINTYIPAIETKEHYLEEYEIDASGNLLFEFSLKDSAAGPIIGIEEKDYLSDTVYVTSLIPFFNGTFDYRDNLEFLKKQLMTFYNKENQTLYIQYYNNYEDFKVLEFLDNNSQVISEFNIINEIKGDWNLINLKVDTNINEVSTIRISDLKHTSYTNKIEIIK